MFTYNETLFGNRIEWIKLICKTGSNENCKIDLLVAKNAVDFLTHTYIKNITINSPVSALRLITASVELAKNIQAGKWQINSTGDFVFEMKEVSKDFMLEHGFVIEGDATIYQKEPICFSERFNL
jgi:hypothetical protein